ncbi:MAG: insulinase family protein, partial [Bacteroidota bacterium]
ETYKVPLHDETLISVCSDKEASNSTIQVTYKHPQQEVKYEKDFKGSITRSLYNRMLGERFREMSRQADAPFNFAYSGYGRNVGDIDAYTSYATVKEGKVREGLEALMTENKRVLDHGFLASELERAKTQTMTSVEKAFKEKDKIESSRLVRRMVSHFLNASPLMNTEQRINLFKKYLPEITLADVNALAAQWITKENRVLVIQTPEKSSSLVPEERALLSLLNSIDNRETEPYTDNVSEEPFFAETLNPVKIEEEKTMESVGAKHIKLANGVEVFMKQTDFKNDEVMMTASSAGGHSLISDEDFMSASMTSPLIGQFGIAKMDMGQMQKALAGKVVRVSPYIGELSEGMSGNASPDDLETMMQLIYMYFEMPRSDELI